MGFLAVVTTLPALFYTHGLGFYFDDHFFLGLMSTSHDQSLGGLYDALTADPKSQLRPVEYFGLALMYRVFGVDPLPYHILLAALVPLCAIALYLALDRLRLPRWLTLATPLLFAMAPHYSSDKFWPDAYSPTLSLALCLISLYASLRAVDGSGLRAMLWLAGAGAAMLASVFMYEITLPLFALVVLYHGVRAVRDRGGWRISAVSLAGLLVAIVGVKLVAAVHLGGESSYGVGYDDGALHHVAYVVSGATKVNFGTYGVGLPYVVGWIALNHLTWSAVAASLTVAVGSFCFLAGGAGRLELPMRMPQLRGRPAWHYLAAAGLVVVIAGYGMFLVTSKVFFTSAGIDNRVNIIAALGMVLIALALTMRLLDLVPARRRRYAFALVVSTLAATGALITTTIGTYWQQAAARQRDVLDGMRAALPTHPRQLIVVLDGTCPEIGPAVVFSAEDLTGALRTIFRNTNVEGVVGTPTMTVRRRDLLVTTYIYNYVVDQSFPYGRKLAVYDSRRRRLHPLHTHAAAAAYFGATPRLQCPKQRTFAWGLRPSRFLPLN